MRCPGRRWARDWRRGAALASAAAGRGGVHLHRRLCRHRRPVASGRGRADACWGARCLARLPAEHTPSLGASLGAVLLFLLARSTLGGWLAEGARPLVERLRPALERDGFAALLALRLLPVVPFWLTNLAPALLGMRLLPYAAATALGIVPATFVLAGIGAGAAEVLERGAGAGPVGAAVAAGPAAAGWAGRAVAGAGGMAARRGRGRPAMPDFDMAVIGAGAAGLSVAAVAAQLGPARGADRARPDGRRLPECRLRAQQGAAGSSPRRTGRH